MIDKNSHIIIKKSRYEEHEEHSSAWKLAFADLMVSLMCVFLVLWALEISDDEEKEQIIQYFRTGELSVKQTSIYSDNNNFVISPIPATGKDNKTEIDDLINTALVQGEYNTQEQLQFLMAKLDNFAESINAGNNIFIEVIPDGLRIVLADSDEHKMFASGSVQLTPFYEDLLLEFASIFNKIENGVVITGHTDAALYKDSSISNWELSSQRANVARKTMEVGGLKQENIKQVVGLADTKPLDSVNKFNSINRRVEVMVLTRQAVAKMDNIYKGDNDSLYSKIVKHKNESAQIALKNEPVTRFTEMN